LTKSQSNGRIQEERRLAHDPEPSDAPTKNRTLGNRRLNSLLGPPAVSCSA